MTGLGWVVLTMGDRPVEVREAVASIRELTPEATVVLLGNGADPDPAGDLASTERTVVIRTEENLGIPGGRARALEHLDSSVPLVGFLDDDARLKEVDVEALEAAFADDSVAVVCCRLVDEHGSTSRRHIPRLGDASAEAPGRVGTFLGGASVLRRSAYDTVGGFWPDLWYGHEELDLSFRLADAGWAIEYRPKLLVFHPRTEVSRHPHGWSRTGRNRVMIARRNLPWPVMLVHVLAWLALGTVRARGARVAYVRGWSTGWRQPVDRRPISWATVWRLTRLGRPPIL